MTYLNKNHTKFIIFFWVYSCTTAFLKSVLKLHNIFQNYLKNLRRILCCINLWLCAYAVIGISFIANIVVYSIIENVVLNNSWKFRLENGTLWQVLHYKSFFTDYLRLFDDTGELEEIVLNFTAMICGTFI